MAATDAAQDWARYWRADGVPVEAMHAHFTSHVYHRHSHETYSFGVTETGAQAFTCRHGRHVSGPGMVMTFNPDDPHDGLGTRPDAGSRGIRRTGRGAYPQAHPRPVRGRGPDRR